MRLVIPLFWAFSVIFTLQANAQSKEEIAFVRSILTTLQAHSFEANREFCGTIGLTSSGRLTTSIAARGGRSSCRPRDPDDAVEIIASFHTHGAYSPNADSEVPSSNDIETDVDEGINGYLATPGGRFWFVNGKTASARQICGLGCLPSDPNFVPQDWGPVAKSYTLNEILRRETE